MTYANATIVSVERSKGEIESTLARYGATHFMSGWSGNFATIAFVIEKRAIRFLLPLPSRDEPEFTETPSRGLKRSPDDARRAWEQACRSRWRALLLVIKAKLEAVECGISTIEDEFLAWTLLPGTNTTVGDKLRGELTKAIEDCKTPKLLLGLTP